MDRALIPVEGEVKNLLDMFEFFLTERCLGKPVGELGESVKDLRLIVARILGDHFMSLPPEREAEFCKALAGELAERAAALPSDAAEEEGYADWCIGEVLMSFECAQGIKESYPEDPVLQKILALDIPILRPFDYGLRGKLKLLSPKKPKQSNR